MGDDIPIFETFDDLGIGAVADTDLDGDLFQHGECGAGSRVGFVDQIDGLSAGPFGFATTGSVSATATASGTTTAAFATTAATLRHLGEARAHFSHDLLVLIALLGGEAGFVFGTFSVGGPSAFTTGLPRRDWESGEGA